MCDWDILYIVYVLLWVAFFFFRFKNYHPRLPHSSLKIRLSRMTVPFASSEHFLQECLDKVTINSLDFYPSQAFAFFFLKTNFNNH